MGADEIEAMPAREHLNPEYARRQELERAFRLVANGCDATLVMEQLSRRLTAKLLHRPMTALMNIEREPLAERP